MQLEFAQAMSDFKTMFPEMDKEVIEAVLRANQGAVDATIDQLLAMSTDNQVCCLQVNWFCLTFYAFFFFLVFFRTNDYEMNWTSLLAEHPIKSY